MYGPIPAISWAPGDVISVRGFGKIIFDDFYGSPKKDGSAFCTGNTSKRI